MDDGFRLKIGEGCLHGFLVADVPPEKLDPISHGGEVLGFDRRIVEIVEVVEDGNLMISSQQGLNQV
jgi:hypothetical protein